MSVARCPAAHSDADDANLVERSRAGDGAAFVALVERHQAGLVRLAGRFVSTTQDAEDVVQEAIIAAYGQMPHFRSESSFSTWLGRIVVYKALRAARCLKRREYVSPTGEPVAAEIPDPATAQRIRESVARLPMKLRLPVVLRFYEDLSGKEIATLLGWKQSTVWTRLYRGLERLRRELQGVELA